MKYKTKEEMKSHIDSLGMSALSKFSAISHLSKLKVPLDGMIIIESTIRTIECGLWNLVPLGLGDDTKTLESQIKNIEEQFENLVSAARLMKFVKEV